MLDHVARYHQIKLPHLEITINQRLDKLNTRINASRDLNATRGSIDSGDLVTECREPASDVTVSATKITDRPHAVELLHELDKHARQLLTGLAITGTLRVPFKLCVRWRCHQLCVRISS